VAGALLGNFYSAGEVCSNGTRVFVQRSVVADFMERLVARTRALRIGDPLDPATQVGSLISQAHMDTVLKYVELGRAEGARLAIGGRRVTTVPWARDSSSSPRYLISAAIRCASCARRFSDL